MVSRRIVPEIRKQSIIIGLFAQPATTQLYYTNHSQFTGEDKSRTPAHRVKTPYGFLSPPVAIFR